MQSLFVASLEPAAALRGAEVELVSSIDRIMVSLADFRVETVAMLREYSEKVEVDRQATTAGVASLSAGIASVDNFVHCLLTKCRLRRPRLSVCIKRCW